MRVSQSDDRPETRSDGRMVPVMLYLMPNQREWARDYKRRTGNSFASFVRNAINRAAESEPHESLS